MSTPLDKINYDGYAVFLQAVKTGDAKGIETFIETARKTEELQNIIETAIAFFQTDREATLPCKLKVIDIFYKEFPNLWESTIKPAMLAVVETALVPPEVEPEQ